MVIIKLPTSQLLSDKDRKKWTSH